MSMIRKTIIYLSLLLPLCAMAQQREIFSTGLIDDREFIRQMPMKKELLTRGYDSTPSSFSLQQYCPRAGSQSFHGQGAYATCTAWATAYAAMTIMEAERWGWTDRDIITSEAFSPLFVYAKTKFRPDENCNKGIGLYTVLPFLREKGAPKHINYSEPCRDDVPRWVADEAADHKITDFVKLFDDPCTDSEKIRVTRKSIAEKKPVIIGMHTPRSFEKAGEIWQGELANGEILSKDPDHCMCVVGYDNNKAGGAFLVMNSWGESWGKDGFTWIKYDDYARYVGYAFEIYGGSEAKPVKILPPVDTHKDDYLPAIISDSTEKVLAGSMYIKLKTGETLDMRRMSKSSCPVYSTREGGSRKFIEGTRFQIHLTNGAPEYVYMIGTDLNNNIDSVFPPNYIVDKCHISPLLSYNSSEIALPNDSIYVELDDRSNRSYLCMLFSTHALPMDRIMDYIKRHDGPVEQKLARALDIECPDERVLPNDINSERDRIAFTATTTGCIVPLIVEMRLQ